MKSLTLLSVLLMSSAAIASHPHDRVCVGEAKGSANETVNFVFQWESGRAYDTGSPSTDGHEVSFEASSCWGDYLDSDCVKSKSETVTYPSNKLTTVPALLKDSKGQIFFEGTFTFVSETLVGKINDGQGKMLQTNVKLNCISQPRLKLEMAQD